MRAVIQRVTSAKVEIDYNTHSEIKTGFLVLLGISEKDTEKEAAYLAKKCSGLRVFTDENDKMNKSLFDVSGKMIVVSNFTLYANCKKGKRPSFIEAARPEKANTLYEFFCDTIRNEGIEVQTGVFGADMKVSLTNDGPITIIMDTDQML